MTVMVVDETKGSVLIQCQALLAAEDAQLQINVETKSGRHCLS